MKSLLFKSIGASMAMAALLVVSACGGGGSSSSGVGAGSGGSGGVSPDATTVVKGNLNGVGGGQAMFDLEQGGSMVSHIASAVADSVIPAANAALPADATVSITDGGTTVSCLGSGGTTTIVSTDGYFECDLSTLQGGNYTINISTGGVDYSASISVEDGTAVTLIGTLDQGEFDVNITITNVQVIGSTSQGEGEGQPTTTICHKPDTPAQQTLVIPMPAVDGHLGHGDALGSCEDITAEPDVAEAVGGPSGNAPE